MRRRLQVRPGSRRQSVEPRLGAAGRRMFEPRVGHATASARRRSADVTSSRRRPLAARCRLLAPRRLAAARPRPEAAGFAQAGWLVRRRRTGVVAVPFLDAQLLLHHPYLLQVLEDFLRHAVGQVDQAVVVADAEAADVLAVQAGLVGDRANDVARLHAVLVADLDAIGALALLGGVGTHRALAELARRRVLARCVLTRPMFGDLRFPRRMLASRDGFAHVRRAAIAAGALARGRLVFLALGRRRQQQRLIALGDARQRRGDLDRRDVVFLLVLLDELLELGQLTLRQRVADALFELADAYVVDHLDRGQLDRKSTRL